MTVSLKVFANRLLPYPVKSVIRVIMYFFYRAAYAGKKYECVICEKKYKRFKRFGHDDSNLYDFKIVGGGTRENSKCPNCGSMERHRLEYIYICNETDIFSKECKVLHFAPEKVLKKKLINKKNIKYYSADVMKGRAMYEVDITRIPFDNSKFDYIICNHVLEHIFDESKALSEIKRVLAPGGKAILTVPISLGSEATIEDDCITTEKERLIRYGQADHVRLYGMDFQKRLEKAGFKVDTFKAKDKLSKNKLNKFVLVPDETIYIAINA